MDKIEFAGGKAAVIVAHGQPSDPAGPEREIAALARKVGSLMPGWHIAGTTLAMPGALETLVQARPDALIFPFFMSDGWFIRTALPRRLDAAMAAEMTIVRPFGLRSEINELVAEMVRDGCNAAGWPIQETVVILAAHGSGRSRYAAEAARATQAALRELVPLAEVRLGFIEEPPALVECLSGAGPRALCLPLFVARWGHVTDDIPNAVSESGFTGRVLSPIGKHARAPGIIADALRAAI